MIFYRRYIGDYMRKTSHLSLLEHGAYTVLLDALYAAGGSLPGDLSALCRVARAASEEEREAVARVAEEFFPLNGDGRRHNERADEEIARAEQRSDSARQSANTRWRGR
jgi:uncharacterized protein YdaU (DUF1376 family)